MTLAVDKRNESGWWSQRPKAPGGHRVKRRSQSIESERQRETMIV